MAAPAELDIETTNSSADLHRYRELLLDVYEDVYRDRLADPFFSPQRYWERLEAYASRQGFSIAIGRCAGTVIGYALGYPLPDRSGWWHGLTTEVDDADISEDGKRTFALNELMIREPWRRRGFARRLHDSLLAKRPEQRATLLVRPDNVAAQAAYASWGWRKLGELKPFDDAPTFDAMVVDLPV